MTEPSPLEEIERIVQTRARELALDADDDPDALAGLVREMATDVGAAA